MTRGCHFPPGQRTPPLSAQGRHSTKNISTAARTNGSRYVPSGQSSLLAGWHYVLAVVVLIVVLFRC